MTDGYVSKTFLTVRYAETDMMGIVHHSRYYPWFEIARCDYIKAAGISYRALEEDGVMMPLTESGAKYIRGLKFDDEVVIACRMEKLSVARCKFVYEVYKLPENVLSATGFTVHGFVASDGFAPMNLKKRMPGLWDKLERLMDGDMN